MHRRLTDSYFVSKIMNRLFIVFALFGCLTIGACTIQLNDTGNICVRQCTYANACQSDGCGGICGCSDPSQLCNYYGQCVAEGDCTETCDSYVPAKQCGSVCRDECGNCDNNLPCVDGYCCTPSCDGTHCGDDGCGGKCTCEEGTCGLDGKCNLGCEPSCGDYPNDKCINGKCVCSPICDGTRCDDGCGGSCTCDNPEKPYCNKDSVCVSPEDCDDTCAEAGKECGGEVCGVPCNAPCAENEICKSDVCQCQPQKCDGTRCDDGCGNPCTCDGECDADNNCLKEGCTDTCGSRECGKVCGEFCGEHGGDCPNGEVCEDGGCFPNSLSVSIQSQPTLVDAGTKRVTLRIDYNPREGEPRPRMADLRLVTEPFTVLKMVSASLLSTQPKDLYMDPYTELPWRIRTDGSVQFLIYSADLAMADGLLIKGPLMTVTFDYDAKAESDGQGAESFKVGLLKRHQTFAPFEADYALQESAYDHAVEVKK